MSYLDHFDDEDPPDACDAEELEVEAMSETCKHPDTSFDRTLCAEPCGAMHNYCTECGECVDPCPHKATPSSGVTEGKAESGERVWSDRPFRCPTCDSAFPELVAASGCDDHWHEPEPRTVPQWRSEVERWAGILEQFSYAKNPVDAGSRLAADMRRELAAQPPAPADDAAEVLSGLVEEMRALARHGAETTIDQSWLKWFHGQHVALVEAAQQRLADRGQSGMPDEFEPYLAEAMKRPGFRAAYEAALRDEENTDG